MVGSFVIVRGSASGVHMGRLVSCDGPTVTLSESRRLYRWRGANTLNEVSQKGVDQSHTRISEPNAGITILDACEIISTTKEAEANLTQSRWGA